MKIRHFFSFAATYYLVRIGILFLMLAAVSSSLFGQSYQDSIQEIAKIKLLKRYSLEQQLATARAQKNVPLEMETLESLFEFISNDFGDLSSSYIYARELEKLIQKNPNAKEAQKLIPGLFHNIGWYLSEQGKLEESIEYFNKSIEADSRDHIGQFFDNMIQLAYVYSKLGQEGKSREVLLSLAEELKKIPADDPDSRAVELRYYKVMRDIKFNDHDYVNGLEYAKKSIDSSGSFAVMSHGYFRLAEFYLQLNELDSAKMAAETSLDIARTHVFKLEEVIAHRILYSIYEKENDYQRAFYHLKKLSEIENEILSFDNALKIGAYDVNSERIKADLEQAVANEKLNYQRTIIWIVSVSLILLLISLFYLFHSLKLIKKKNKIIEKEKQRAERSERFKEQFLANMSHEIRTPMHAISGMLDALKRRQLSKEQGTYLDAMKISVNNLLAVINEILDLSKIEAGSLQLVSVPMDVKEIVHDVVNLLGPKATEKGVTLQSNVVADFPGKILGDPVRLNQILVNLVGNAIKFTEEGSVGVSLRNNADYYRLEIQDTGIGIPKDSIQSVFEIFKQGEDGLNKGYAGTGLGLSITKKLVESQGGRVWAESELGKGSTFFVELPLEEAHAVESDDTTEEEQHLLQIGKALAGLHILIAEDEPFNVMVAEDYLKWYIPDLRLTVVENGALAVQQFQEDDYDLILMDIQMPVIDGYEATRKIRELERQKDAGKTPVIAMTAGILKNQVELSREAGMDAHVLKPYQPEELITCIFELVK